MKKTLLVTVDAVPVAKLDLTDQGLCNLVKYRIEADNAFLHDVVVTLAPDSIQPISAEEST